MNKIFVITLFPDLFPGPLGVSIFKKSFEKHWDMQTVDLRNFGVGKHKCVDDTVFSGLPGMLIRPDVVEAALDSLKLENARKIFLSPRGPKIKQSDVEEMALDYSNKDFVILCGRYEGVDQRAIDHLGFEEWSIGDYIIAGGESASFVLLESIIRKIPGVIGNEGAFENETFANNEISEPRYTKPAVWNTLDGKVIEVNSILRSGNHKEIELFQKAQRKCIVNDD
jgi:tRNA (guanine37-N1)-methyltransferase